MKNKKESSHSDIIQAVTKTQFRLSSFTNIKNVLFIPKDTSLLITIFFRIGVRRFPSRPIEDAAAAALVRRLLRNAHPLGHRQSGTIHKKFHQKSFDSNLIGS